MRGYLLLVPFKAFLNGFSSARAADRPLWPDSAMLAARIELVGLLTRLAQGAYLRYQARAQLRRNAAVKDKVVSEEEAGGAAAGGSGGAAESRLAKKTA
jgi:hypothetical protein